jgi:polyhydroxyalkanoate synthase
MSKKTKATKKNTAKPQEVDILKQQMEALPSPAGLSQALLNAYQHSQPMFMEMLKIMQETATKAEPEEFNPDPMNVSGASFNFINAFTANPLKFMNLQMEYAQKQADLWQNSLLKLEGQTSDAITSPEKGDRRFKGEVWDQSIFFDFIKQYYLLACKYVEEAIDSADEMSEQDRKKLNFASKLMLDALSPSNFIFTNPEVLKETVESGGANLIRGFEHMQKDLERGKGQLKISTTDYKAFEFGKNIAVTEGSVVYQNDLMQLIQYAPTTEKVFKKPLLIIPPWINKYYILDLQPQTSYIKWAVDQGYTVFCISWVNPDAKLALKGFEDYMLEGPLAALDEIKKITKEEQCNVVGYCLGGTLLTTLLSYLTEKKQVDRIASATFLTTLVDFAEAGDLKLFMDDEQIEAMTDAMSRKGVLEAKELQRTFALLRANDMIWSFVVNNYLMGKEPFPFDLLFWNDDSTNMPAAMHGFYLKNMYRDNLLCKPKGLKIAGVDIDATKIKTPSYFLSTKDDHIAPWKATYETTQLFKGPVKFTLAASGHIAGVVNPPAKKKYCYWSAEKTPRNPQAWFESAKETSGSWWPDWHKWLKPHSGTKVTARKIKKPIEPAPGSYVKVKSE